MGLVAQKMVHRYLLRLGGHIYDHPIPRQVFFQEHPEERNAQVHKKTYTEFLTAASFTTARKWEQPKCPSIREWINVVIQTLENYAATIRE